MFTPKIYPHQEVMAVRDHWFKIWGEYTRHDPDLVIQAQRLTSSPIVKYDLDKRFIAEPDRLRVILSSLVFLRYTLGKEVANMLFQEGPEEVCTATIELVFKSGYDWNCQNFQLLLLCTVIIRLCLHTVSAINLTKRYDDLISRIPLPDDYRANLGENVLLYLDTYKTHTIH
jgi:hypothetical protein